MENATTITVALLLASISLKLTDLTKYVTLFFKAQSAKSALDDTAESTRTDEQKKALKEAQNNRKEALNGVLTLAVGAILGVLAAFVLRASDWGDEILVGDENLASLSAWSTVIFGIVFSTAAGTLYDFKKAVDQEDTAKKPKLISYEQPPKQ